MVRGLRLPRSVYMMEQMVSRLEQTRGTPRRERGRMRERGEKEEEKEETLTLIQPHGNDLDNKVDILFILYYTNSMGASHKGQLFGWLAGWYRLPTGHRCQFNV